MDSAQSSRSRAPITPLRAISLSEITLDMQRHLVIIDDRETSQKRRYMIETTFKTREGYCYVVSWKPIWEEVEQPIASGSRFETADLAVSSALLKIEAWERWLEASSEEQR